MGSRLDAAPEVHRAAKLYRRALRRDVPDCICKHAPLHARDRAGADDPGPLGRSAHQRHSALPRHVPRDLLHSGHYLMGHRLAHLPVHFQHRGNAQLCAHECAAPDGVQHPLARQPLGRSDGGDDARHLEGRRMESGRISGRAAKRSAGAV